MAFINLPFSLTAKAKGYTILFDYVDVLGEQQTVMWVAKEAWLKANRAAVVDFLEDALRMRRWLEDPANRKQAIEILAAVTRQPVKDLEPWAFTGIDAYHDPNMLPDVEMLQRNVNDLVPFGLAQKAADVHRYVDLSYVKEAAARLDK
jgi:NitT/TauT family transport system substrate-binding protein